MKKILYVTTVSSTLNAFLLPHIKHLIERGNYVEIASNIDQQLAKEFDQLQIKHNKIQFSRNPFNFTNIKAYKDIRLLFNKERYDVVHVHTPVAAFVTRVALRKKSVKIVYTAHGFHFYKGAPIINWILYYPMEKLAARWTDILVTINHEDYTRAKRFHLRNNGEVKLMHGVGINPEKYNNFKINRDQYRLSLGVEKGDFLILVLAEINKNKNHIQLIRAINEIKNSDPSVKVLCAGKGPLESKLKCIVNKLGIDNRVKFLGFRNDINELLYCCDCVGLFSKREGLGKCLLEGMYFGKFLLATNTRGPRELVDDKNGLLVPIGDYKYLAKCISKISRSRYNSKSVKEYSQKKIEKYYMKNIFNEIEEYY